MWRWESDVLMNPENESDDASQVEHVNATTDRNWFGSEVVLFHRRR